MRLTKAIIGKAEDLARASMLPTTVIFHRAKDVGPYTSYRAAVMLVSGVHAGKCTWMSGNYTPIADEPSPVVTVLPPRWFEPAPEPIAL